MDTILSSCPDAIELAHLILFKTFLNRPTGGVGKGQRKSERDRGLSSSGPAPASPLHSGTHLSGGLSLLYCYW